MYTALRATIKQRNAGISIILDLTLALVKPDLVKQINDDKLINQNTNIEVLIIYILSSS